MPIQKKKNAYPIGDSKYILVSLPSSHPLLCLFFLSALSNYWLIFLLYFILHFFNTHFTFVILHSLPPFYSLLYTWLSHCLTEALSFVKLISAQILTKSTYLLSRYPLSLSVVSHTEN